MAKTVKRIKKRMAQKLEMTGDWFSISRRRRGGPPRSNLTGDDIYALMVDERGQPSSPEEEAEWRKQARKIWNFLIDYKKAEENAEYFSEKYTTSLENLNEYARGGEEVLPSDSGE